MKTILIVALSILILTASVAMATDLTTLTAPLTITNPATTMKQYSFTIIPSENRVVATMQFKDVDGNTVSEKECTFIDPAVAGANIGAGKVGQKYIDVMAGFIQTKCKGLWGLTGTDN